MAQTEGGNNGMHLDGIFHPNSVAVVGVSNAMMSPGLVFLEPLLNSGFKGTAYAVHRNGGEVLGLPCYRSISDIPGPVDHVIVCIPARYTPSLIEECVAKGVKSVHFFTAGFSETGEEDGKVLESQVLEIAHRGGIRLIGPNCMGLYCPSSGLAFCSDLSQQSGPLGLICQSGGNAIYIARAGASRGVPLSKGISYGNACDVDESEVMEYMTHDPETKIIAAYIEGVKDGPRFLGALREATKIKPVIILKGGQSEFGARTIASHTGSLAGSNSVWDAMLSQSGAIRVHTLDEIVDLAMTFTHMPVPGGRRVGIIGIGGGASVLAADDCAAAGLSLPRPSEEVKQQLQSLTPTAGYMFSNPIDTQAFMEGSQELIDTVKIMAAWDGVDMILLHLAYDLMGASLIGMVNMGFTRFMVETMISAAKNVNKPIAAVLHFNNLDTTYKASFDERQILQDAGIPVFSSFGSAAIAVDRFLRYHGK